MPNLPSHQRRPQLVEAALRVAKRDGVAAVSTRAVAAEAAVTPGIVHYVFTSMDEVYREMIAYVAEQQVELVRAAQVRGAELRESMRLSFESMWAALEADPEAHLMTFEVAQMAVRRGLPELAQWQYACNRDAARAILEELSETTATAWSVPVDDLARMLVVVNDGVIESWLADRDSEAARRVYGLFLDHLESLALPRGTIELVIWLAVVVVVVLVGVGLVALVGRGTPMQPVYDDRRDIAVPEDRPLTAQDLDGIRFSSALMGYRMEEVDALLARLRAELDSQASSSDRGRSASASPRTPPPRPGDPPSPR